MPSLVTTAGPLVGAYSGGMGGPGQRGQGRLLTITRGAPHTLHARASGCSVGPPAQPLQTELRGRLRTGLTGFELVLRICKYRM